MERPSETVCKREDVYLSVASEQMRQAYTIVQEQLKATFKWAQR